MDAEVRLRDRDLAKTAYRLVEELVGSKPDSLGDYEIAVQRFAGSLRRDGLAAAVSGLQREKGERGEVVLRHLATALAPAAGLPSGRNEPTAFADAVRCAGVDRYTLLARQAMELVTWLRRAVQAAQGARPASTGVAQGGRPSA